MMDKMKKILVVVAHPDDDILGCGGTLCKLIKSGKDIKVVILGEGSTCRFLKEKINSVKAKRTINQRKQFEIEALKILGISEFIFYNLPCGRFDSIPIIDIGKLVENEINTFNPDTIFTHFEKDTNNDHRLVFQAVLQATRPGAQNIVDNVLSFEILSSTEWRFTEGFKPNYFVNIEFEIKNKINAFSKFITEQKPFPFPRSSEGIKILSKYRGMQAAVQNAEAFFIVRSIVK